MAESLEQKIDRFYEYFREQIEAAREVSPANQQGIQRKVLYCTILDAMSKSILNKESSNRKRFTKFILDFSNWKQSSNISLMHLTRLLEINNTDVSFENLRTWCFENFKKRFKKTKRIIANRFGIDFDPSYSEVIKRWPKDSNNFKKLSGLLPEYLQHVSLLYSYRNALIHEYRHLGMGSQWKDDKEPFYQEVKIIESCKKETGLQLTGRWEMVYPYEFFYSLCHESLINLITHMQEKDVSPFVNYTTGSYWIPELNDFKD